jgi:hypothetical protein
MRKSFIAAFTAIALSLSLTGGLRAVAQEESSAPAIPHKVLGYQDKAGVFHPFQHAEPETTPAATTGTFVISITVTLDTAVPSGGSVYCFTDILATSVAESNPEGAATYEESNYVKATVSGSTATCSIKTPYSWNLPAASSTTLNSIGGTYTVAIVPSTTTVVASGGISARSSTADIPGLTKIPATGATTNIAFKATL